MTNYIDYQQRLAGFLLSLFMAIGAGISGLAYAGEVIGRVETVIDNSEFSCRGDRPDIPTSAFRRSNGSIVMITGNRQNIVSEGTSFKNLKRSRCRSLLRGSGNADPSQFDDQKWVTQLYSFNGRNVTAFVHDEYHGEHHGENCRIRPIGDRQCWYASATRAVSKDGGFKFRLPPVENRVIISPPSRYVSKIRRVGTFMPKVVGDPSGGFVYVLVSNTNRNTGIRIGQCLLRSTDQTMSQWQLWNGRKWTKAPQDSYAPGARRTQDCKPVLAGNILSVRYVPRLKSYVAVGSTNKTAFMRYSPDLINWGPIRPIKGISPQDRKIKASGNNNFPRRRWYFSLLDPLSKSRNFDTVSLKPYLYFVQFGGKSDRRSRIRSLKRVRVALKP